MAPRIPKGQKLPSTDYQEDTLSVHDCVLINPDSSQATTPYVGKIMHIIQPDDDNEIQLYVNWFYKPEEAFGGRKTFHGEKEVFISDHFDVCSLSTVISKCRVLSLPKYQELKKIEDGDYFARFTYRPAVQLFEPPRVPVFCRCEMPYNPDQFMVCCDACTEWYHPECLNTTKRAVQAADKWKCPDCERYSQMAVAAPGSQVQDVIPASKRTRVES